MATIACNVLFLCTGNSARSILAESVLNHVGRNRYRGFSAGSHPNGTVNPFAVELLKKNNFPTDGLRSKSWDEFAQPAAPVMDVVITVCDQAAGEVCPVWPGQPINAHWGVDDPAKVEGDEETKRRAFLHAYTHLRRRIEIFCNLPMANLDRMALKRQLDDIGRT